MILLVLAYLGGVLTILSPCILPVLPFVFARSDRPFLRSGLPLLIGMALMFAVVASLAAVGSQWVAQANQVGRWIALVVMALFALALLASGRDPGDHYAFAQLPAHFLLIQNWGFADQLRWNDPAWSISTEWAAYLLLAMAGGWLARRTVGPWSFPCLVLALSAGLGLWFAATGR